MKYFKVQYLVVNGKNILAEMLFVYADEKQLPHQQLKDKAVKNETVSRSTACGNSVQNTPIRNNGGRI